MKIPAQCQIDVTLAREGTQGGGLPDFIIAGHRHLEKEQPISTVGETIGHQSYHMPVDLVRMVVPDPSLIDSIQEVTLVYFKR